MSDTDSSAAEASHSWQDLLLIARLCAIDPFLAGGVVVRGCPGPVRDRWLAELRALLGDNVVWRTVPIHVDDDRLLGGIDLAATLQCGRAVARRGLLAEVDGGILLLSMAERMSAGTAAHIVAALDTGLVRCLRDGISASERAVFGVVALDESIDDEEPVGAALRDRLAYCADLRGLSHRALASWAAEPCRDRIDDARRRLAEVRIGDDIVEALCAAALALGVGSLRASMHAVRAARAAAALAGRVLVTAEDAAVGARLVLAPRATQSPGMSQVGEDEPGDSRMQQDGSDVADHSPSQEDRSSAADEMDTQSRETPLEDAIIAAAAAAIPAGLLERMTARVAGEGRRGAPGRSGAVHASQRRGRPSGVLRDRPRGGVRLDLMATLRAAVPWQRVRGRGAGTIDGESGVTDRIRIRADDFHVSRLQQRSHTTTIFAVDASGSSALHRLAEAKGAVELLLADCYVRRDSVAVIGFRGRGAELLLPPTRSLVRAKRALAELPGGGGTPLAAGIDAARVLAEAVRRRGDSAVVVILSDGRANVSRDGAPGRTGAEGEARAAARLLRECAALVVFVDTATQSQPSASELAALMGARYLFLPHADAQTLSAAVRRVAPSHPAARTPLP